MLMLAHTRARASNTGFGFQNIARAERRTQTQKAAGTPTQEERPLAQKAAAHRAELPPPAVASSGWQIGTPRFPRSCRKKIPAQLQRTEGALNPQKIKKYLTKIWDFDRRSSQ
jgi:hypothetical protein